MCVDGRDRGEEGPLNCAAFLVSLVMSHSQVNPIPHACHMGRQLGSKSVDYSLETVGVIKALPDSLHGIQYQTWETSYEELPCHIFDLETLSSVVVDMPAS